MPLVPLKQTVTITPATEARDRFDRPVMGTPYELRCRFQQEARLVSSLAEGTEKEAVSSGHFIFDKLAAITFYDQITYTNELDQAKTYKPLSIEVKRGLNGKPLLTVVYV